MKNPNLVSRITNHSHIGNEMTIHDVVEEIRSDKHKATIAEIRRLNDAGEFDAASRLKAQLPGVTFSGTFKEKRRAENIDVYNFQCVFDLDHIPAEKREQVRQALEKCRYTHVCFDSPRMGLKVVLRGMPMEFPEGSTPQQEQKLRIAYHKQLFKQGAAHIEKLTGCEVDKSGSDLPRVCYLCHDEKAFFRPGSVKFPVTLENDTGFKAELRRVHKELRQTQGADLNISIPLVGEKGGKVRKSYNMHFQAMVMQLSRTEEYKRGNRNNFLYTLSCMCNEAGIPKNECMALVAWRYPDLPAQERNSTLESAYSNTENHGIKPLSKPAIRVLHAQEFLSSRFEFRYNEITCKLEFRKVGADQEFTVIDDFHLNSFWVELSEHGSECTVGQLHSILKSEFSPVYNPLKEYFNNLPQWDKTDHIGRFADRVKTTTPEYWRICLEKWLCAMVATVVRANVQNHAVLILTGDQSIGKTTFARSILPPELSDYYSEAKISSENKDDMLMVASKLIINTEEIDGMTGRELNQYKGLITRSGLSIRLPYERSAKELKRIATFMGTTNNLDILTDTTGTRRFLCFETLSFDNESPINHQQLYAQVMHMLQDKKCRFWFTKEEALMIDKRNERFVQMTAEEELIMGNLRKPGTGDKISYLTASDIADLLHKRNGLNITHGSKVTIGRVMRKMGFEQMASRSGAFKHKVHVINFEEVTLNKHVNDEVKKNPDATQQNLDL
ncbi:VapE domain-containing protein [Bacteroides sedimenti]|uniref:Virulence protein E n=1 Tax=Bacteroides sedimenti TaxID=2136147 RepID=A0ABM8IAH0_9BACE